MSNIVPFAIPSKEEDLDGFQRFINGLEKADAILYMQKLPDDGGYSFGNTPMDTRDLILYYHHILSYIQFLISGGSEDDE